MTALVFKLRHLQQGICKLSNKICYNLVHTKPLFWIHLLDVQGVGAYLFIDILYFDSIGCYTSIVWSHEERDSRFVLFYYYFKNGTIFMFWIPSNVILRQYILSEHVKQANTLIIICHCSVCLIYDLSKAGRSTQLLMLKNHPAGHKLCFLSEERFFSSVLDLKKLSLLHLLRVLSDTRKKQNWTAKQQYTVVRIIANFFGHPV